MKRFWSRAIAAALALLAVAPALALENAAIPPKFGVPWAASAGGAYVRSIPTTSQIGIQNCAASLTDGFPPLTFVPAIGGGCPPFGQDFNGILKQLSQWSQWQAARGQVVYDSAFSAQINGYPAGAVLASRIVGAYQWLSVIDNNTSDPDAGGAGWVQAPYQVLTGTPVPSFSTTVPFGYVSANGLTIGNSSSNATGLASGATQFLFTYIWSNCSNALCPIYTSTGAGTSRGATAASDFAANKAIATYNINGAGLVGADSQAGSSSGNLAGVPVQSGTTTAPGSLVGENLHALTAGENGAHAHANTLIDPGHAHANTLSDPGHVHTNTVIDPGHAHANTLSDPGHAHSNTLTDPGHAHANTLSDPGHVHSVAVADPGHFHTNSGITRAQFAISSGGTGPFLYGASIGGGAGALIDSNTTGITAAANSHVTGVTINNAAATTGLSVNNAAATTGLSVNNASAATGITSSAQNHATGVSINNAANVTGLSITNANSGSGTGHNTVPRSLTVYWLLKL